MPDLGSQLRDYYESVVERVETDRVEGGPLRRTGTARGLVVAAVTAAVTILLFGLVWLVGPESSDPVEVPPPSTTTPTTLGEESPAEGLAPSVVVLADGTQITEITDAGPLMSLNAYQSLSEFVLAELTGGSAYWPEGLAGGEALGLNPAEQTGLTVELTIEPDVQQVVETVIADWHDDPETFISVVVVDNSTGEVLAAGPGSADDGTVFLPEQQVLIGSLAQVYTTVAAIESGITIDSRWDGSSPQTFTVADGSEWTVRGVSAETVTLGEALYRAVNTVFGRIGVELGAEAIVDTADRLGVDIRSVDLIAPPEAVAIGSGTTNTFDAAAMFATLSREGVRTEPTIIRSITDTSGQVIYQANTSTQITVDPDTVETVRQPLSEVPYIGTAAGVLGDFDRTLNPIGKTGTAEDHKAAWYVGSTDQYTVAVTVGRHDGAPLQDVTFNGQTYARVFGSSVPAPIWKQIVNQLTQG